MTSREPWLPPGRSAAVCLTVDDVHPTAAENGRPAGEVAREALGHLEWLLGRHPQLKATLFTTPDWRSRGVYPTRHVQRIPLVRNLTYATAPHPKGTLRLTRHPSFCDYLKTLERVDLALHGLHHIRRGPAAITEFTGRSRAVCRRILREGQQIMEEAGLEFANGLTPPGWNAPPELLGAMADLGMHFIASARDLETPITRLAQANGSGLRGVSLIFPERLRSGELVHLTTNFQATSPYARAHAILENGGLLSVKAHLLKRFGRHEALDGLDRDYVAHLDGLFTAIEDRYGDSIFWTTMADIATGVRAQVGAAGAAA